MSKEAEMFTEAIPAGVLQAYAFAISSNRSPAAFASILISALTTGFGSALISYGESLKGCQIRGPLAARGDETMSTNRAGKAGTHSDYLKIAAIVPR